VEDFMSASANIAPRLNCESLESRDTPVGNVAVGVSNANILMVGDNNFNQVLLAQDGFGDVFAIGLFGTTVNGQSSIFLGRFFPNNVTILGGGGDDWIQVANLVSTGTIAVGPGDEFDRVDIVNVSAAAVIVGAGAGNDTVVMDNVVAWSFLWIDGGSGADLLHFNNVFSNDPNVFNFEVFV
jgi:hypothetical protein